MPHKMTHIGLFVDVSDKMCQEQTSRGWHEVKESLMLRNPHATCLGPTKGCWDLQSQPNAVQKQQNWQGHHWCPVLLTDMSRCVRRIRIVGKCYTSFLSTTTSSGPASSAVLRQTSIRLHNGSGWFLLPNWKN